MNKEMNGARHKATRCAEFPMYAMLDTIGDTSNLLTPVFRGPLTEISRRKTAQPEQCCQALSAFLIECTRAEMQGEGKEAIPQREGFFL